MVFMSPGDLEYFRGVHEKSACHFPLGSPDDGLGPGAESCPRSNMCRSLVSLLPAPDGPKHLLPSPALAWRLPSRLIRLQFSLGWIPVCHSRSRPFSTSLALKGLQVCFQKLPAIGKSTGGTRNTREEGKHHREQVIGLECPGSFHGHSLLRP